MSEKSYEYTRAFNQPSDKVWRFLTDSDKLSRWFLPNDFSLDGNGEFRMWTTPSLGWDGVLNGKINEFVENEYLSYELKTSVSNQTSKVDWSIEENHHKSYLNLTHEGSEELVETIYQAINGTQVSGHFAKSPANKAATPQSSIVINAGPEKSFLETLRSELLSDPEQIETNVSRAVTKYPGYAEHVVCLAVEAFPEKAMSILEAAKGLVGGQFQRLLGLTLFLLLFKNAISDAQARVAAEDPATQDEMLDELDDEDGLEACDIEDLHKPEELLKQFKAEMMNGQFRVAAGIALAVMVLVTSDDANAKDFFAFQKDGLELVSLDGEEEIVLNSADAGDVSQASSLVPQIFDTDGQGVSKALSGLAHLGVITGVKSGSLEILGRETIDRNGADGSGKKQALKEDTETLQIKEFELSDEAILLDGEFFIDELSVYEGPLYFEYNEPEPDEPDWMEELLFEFEESYFGNVDLDIDDPEEYIEDDEHLVDEGYWEDGGGIVDIDDVHDQGVAPISEEDWNVILAFVEFVEDRTGHEVSAVVLSEHGPDIIFKGEDLNEIVANYGDLELTMIVLDSEEVQFVDDDLPFDEMESYTTAAYVDAIIYDDPHS